MQIHLLRCILITIDGASHAVALKFFDDEKAAALECGQRNQGLGSVMGWRVSGPSGEVGGALGGVLGAMGLKSAGYDVVSVETEGAIVKPDSKIVLVQ